MEHIFSFLSGSASYLIPFVVVLSVVVFVHEFGHFWIARLCGVKIETFSIGFGPEICGWNDKKATRWRVAWLPLGGYVKMFGDSDPSSFGPDEKAKEFTEDEKKVAFFSQPLRKRFAIVAAGPGANYLFALVVLAILYGFNGQPYTSTLVDSVMEGSTAQIAGIHAGDKVLSIDGKTMDSFETIRRTIALNAGQPITIAIERDGAVIELPATPQMIESTDRFGGQHRAARLGITSTATEIRPLSPAQAVSESAAEIWNITSGTLKGVGQMIMGVRAADELGGPLRIAEMSGKVAKDGGIALIWFIVVISVNLGLINLFPIPLLDGGHLLFYAAEGLRGRPLSERVQEMGFRFGAGVVLFLMLFATWNDLVHLRVVSFITGLFS